MSKYCPKCGTENKDGMKYCKFCGCELPAENVGAAKKKGGGKSALSKTLVIAIAAAVLCAAGAAAFVVIWSQGESDGDAAKNDAAATQTTVSEQSTAVETTAEVTTQPTTAELVEVPDVEGKKYDDAKKAVTDAGLKCNMELEESDFVAADYVISQSPVSGKKIESGETVTIYVSKASQSKQSESSASSYVSGSSSSSKILYCCASEFATLRGSPSRNGAEITKIYCRGAVEWLGSSGEFYYVRYGNKTGYVLMDYFSTDRSAPLNYGDD